MGSIQPSQNHRDVQDHRNGSDFTVEDAIIDVNYPTRSLEFLQSELRTDQPGGRNSEPRRLTILIIGAGLGGLAAAIALALKAHTVTVLEQARTLGEIGAGIQVPSNCSRILHKLGLGPYLEPHVVEPEGISFRRWEDGSKIGYTKLVPDFREKFDAPFYVVHRAHLHQAMLERALEAGVEVKTKHKVRSYSDSGASVFVEGVGEISADLVVAADGIHSLARPKVNGQSEDKPVETGFAAYRATVDVEKMKEDPDTSWLLESPAQNIWIGEGRHVMTYSISSGKYFNMVLSHIDQTDPSTWHERNPIKDMRREFAGWDPRLVKVINLVSETAKWPLRIGRPQHTWLSRSSNRLLLIGDAAHAMLPYMSQGAAMAIEDGAALAEALDYVREGPTRATPHLNSTPNASDSLTEVLKIYEGVRRQRATQMQQASLVNGKLWHFADGPEQQARDAAMRLEVLGKAFARSANQWSDPVTQSWAYGYDAVSVMRQAFGQAGLGREAL